MRYFRRLFAAFAVAALIPVGAARAEGPAIAAASDLQFALAEVTEAFRVADGREVRLTFGSSGNFLRQIQDGAPFEMFMSADEQFIFDLAARELTENDGDLYAVGGIVLFVPDGSPLLPDGTLNDLAAALADGRVTRFAIANPEHAPYGRRAEEALRHTGLWDAIHDKLVLGENVSQAAQFATTGGAEGSIVALSLALSPSVSSRGNYALIPDEWHQPLRQRMVLLNGAGETARAFYAFLLSEPSRAIMRRYGFVLPGESS